MISPVCSRGKNYKRQRKSRAGGTARTEGKRQVMERNRVPGESRPAAGAAVQEKPGKRQEAGLERTVRSDFSARRAGGAARPERRSRRQSREAARRARLRARCTAASAALVCALLGGTLLFKGPLAGSVHGMTWRTAGAEEAQAAGGSAGKDSGGNGGPVLENRALAGNAGAGGFADGGETQEGIYLNDTAPGGDGSQAQGRAVSGEAGEEPEINQLDSALTMANSFADTEDRIVILENGVNLRADSQTSSRIIAQLQAGDVLERTGENEEWSRVLYNGITGYVSSQFTEVQKTAELSEEAVPGADAPAGEGVEEDSLVHAASEGEAQPVSNGRIVVLDAGHQGKENAGKEPAGPDSSAMRQKMPAGAVGTSLGLKESDVTLAIAKKAERILSERGYQVIMARKSNDVNISCSERAELANQSGAGALIHIHAHSQESSAVSGVLATCQSSGNPYNSSLSGRSYSLSRSVSENVSQAAGANNRGVQQTDTLSEINWSQVPVTVLEVGFLSNRQEELLLSQDEYQERIALGIANGIDQFFASGQ